LFSGIIFQIKSVHPSPVSGLLWRGNQNQINTILKLWFYEWGLLIKCLLPHGFMSSMGSHTWIALISFPG
jgi:hypothetical protein